MTTEKALCKRAQNHLPSASQKTLRARRRWWEWFLQVFFLKQIGLFTSPYVQNEYSRFVPVLHQYIINLMRALALKMCFTWVYWSSSFNPPQEEFIRGALAEVEAERDEARRQLEEERRLHMAARHQAAVALRLEQQHQSHKADHDQHDHTHDHHTHCDHDHEHSGEEATMLYIIIRVKMKILVGFWLYACSFCNPIGQWK